MSGADDAITVIMPLLNGASEYGPTGSHATRELTDVTALAGGRFSALVNHLEKSGTIKLGSFKCNASLAQRIMGDEGMMTQGSDNADSLDWSRRIREEEQRTGPDDHGWNDDVTLDAYVVTVANAALPDERGLLRHLVLQYNRGTCTLQAFGLPAVQAVINYKWTAYCQRLLFWQLLVFLAWLASYTVFCIVIQDEDESMTRAQLLQTSGGRVEVVCELICLLAMIPFLYVEASTMSSYGPWAWLSNWNLMDCVAYTCQVAISVMHLSDSLRPYTNSTWYQALLAAQVVVLYLKLQYFTRVFHPGKPSFVDTMAAVMVDLGWFFAFYVLVVWAFALAFYTLFTNDQEKFQDFSNIWRSMVATFSALTGGMDFHDFLDSSSPVLMSVVYIVFQFSMVMVLSNLIMGFVVNGVSKVSEDEGLKQLLSKASLVDEGDSLLPAWVEARMCFPRYVHVLKVNPRSIDKVKLDPQWPVAGVQFDDDGDNGDGQQEEQRRDAAQGPKLTPQEQLQTLITQMSRMQAHIHNLAAAQGISLPDGAAEMSPPSSAGNKGWGRK